MSSVVSVFFFQAEDGIRDGHVTGVQTCALPISPLVPHLAVVTPSCRPTALPRRRTLSASTQPPPPGATRRANRGAFSGRTAFIFAAIGSAVGLGNIWRFPAVAYENGGGAFILPYLVALLTAGIPLLFLDYAIGHRWRGSAPASLRRFPRQSEERRVGKEGRAGGTTESEKERKWRGR